MSRVVCTLIVAVALLSTALWRSCDRAGALRRECSRLESNQGALLSHMESYRVRDSLNASSVRVLTLRASEAEAGYASLVGLVRDMGIKLKRLEALSQSAVESRYEISAPVTDTIVAAVPRQSIRYDNGHVTMHGNIESGVFQGVITSHDTLTQVIHRVPRRFLFFRWGTRELRQQIVSSNPHSRIVYSQYLKIER